MKCEIESWELEASSSQEMSILWLECFAAAWFRSPTQWLSLPQRTTVPNRATTLPQPYHTPHIIPTHCATTLPHHTTLCNNHATTRGHIDGKLWHSQSNRNPDLYQNANKSPSDKIPICAIDPISRLETTNCPIFFIIQKNQGDS